MNNCEQYFNDTCKLMRNYMEKIQPQRFASAWELFTTLKKRCEIYGIEIQDVSDILAYAKTEHIERFGF